ncbi:Pr6Pr family membrane protein [Oerskovia sp. M15]
MVAWLVVGPRPRIDTATIWWSVVAPITWIVYIFVQGASTHWYPYPFMDVNGLGYPQALLNTGIVAVVFLLLATLLGWIDRRMKPAPSAADTQDASRALPRPSSPGGSVSPCRRRRRRSRRRTRARPCPVRSTRPSCSGSRQSSSSSSSGRRPPALGSW